MGSLHHFRLLGLVQVERDGRLVRGFESHKALALLCYLAMQVHPVPRSHLADLFWEGKPEARGRGNLSRVLHNIATLLPGCLQADRDSVQFNRGNAYWLDVEAFEETAKRGLGVSMPQAGEGTERRRSPPDPLLVNVLTLAVDLYRDDFMAGIYLDDCPEFEVWLVTQRERWRQRFAWVLHTLIAHYICCGEYEPGLRYASRLLNQDPWREEAHRQMMLLLALSGQRSAALVQYEICRRTLAKELGVTPTAETIALYKRIRAEEIGRRP